MKYPKNRIKISKFIGQLLYDNSFLYTRYDFVNKSTDGIVKFIQNNYRRRNKKSWQNN